ncbi:hypothetical protein HMPREF9333_02014 [Johnsonella ignava ATCC 51276]|uniref:ParB-like N-terminal domain-containing protein n=1 Tax=Johnsonella ignava ATCC 51276 TaxID=679200 RepID=G5GKC3_9FIRM|nr:ParB/RepB/Spo0J family partition protein [Johnsonella ignava]EHI54813.1 hypothetical protein HMPREF9333_02014 [Johnsonella ignava ATCC 51276]
MTSKKRGLGKGLNAVFGESNILNTEEDDKISVSNTADGMNKADEGIKGDIMIKVSLIEPNMNQPRKEFRKEELDELTQSIKQYGVLQPIIVKKNGERYEIIAGERRWRAAQKAGLTEIPAVIREYSKRESIEISIIENIQRADLNPLEEARAYNSLLEEYGLKHEEIAERVSKSRAAITNSLRLLKLDESIQQLVAEKKLNQGQARALLSIEDKDLQKQAAQEVIKKDLNVRKVEQLVKLLQTAKKRQEKTDDESKETRDYSLFYKDYEEKIRSKFSAKVRINRKDKNKGRIEIEYYSQAELERIIELINSIRG